MVTQRSGVLVEILLAWRIQEVEGGSLVLKLRNWMPAQSIAPRMTPSYLFIVGNVWSGPSGVEVSRETSIQKRGVEITPLRVLSFDQPDLSIPPPFLQPLFPRNPSLGSS